MIRQFSDEPAVRRETPLDICLLGPQKSGKTWSALELATGMQRVFGGDIFLIDTEGGRGEHYADYFTYRYVAFPPPHNALAYKAAIDYSVQRGAGVVIVDSMTHEHSGEGGLLRTIEDTLDRWCGSLEGLEGTELRKVEACRNKRQALASIRPKAERDRLSLAIEQYGPKLNGIFCYRAKTKLKFKKGEDPKELGWQPDTTSPLFYAMTATFLLPPFSNGVPTWQPETEAERLYLSLPQQFRGWFKEGMRLTPGVGERMARWAKGEAFDVAASRQATAPGTMQLPHAREVSAASVWAEIKARVSDPDEQKSVFGSLLPQGKSATPAEAAAALAALRAHPVFGDPAEDLPEESA